VLGGREGKKAAGQSAKRAKTGENEEGKHAERQVRGRALQAALVRAASQEVCSDLSLCSTFHCTEL